jgi:hypothetical protein
METQDRIQRPGIASGIRDISAGDPLRVSWLNRIVAGVRAQNQLDFRNPGIGWPALPQMLRAKNVSASAMTPWEAVEITGFNSGHEVPLILEVDSPSAVNVSLGAVTAYRIGAGNVGWVYTHGICLVQHTGSLSIGDRVGTQSASGVVAEVPGGLWEVIGTTSIDGTDYAVVRFLNQTGLSVVPITVTLPAQKVPDGDYVDLWTGTMPTGKGMYILGAYIADHTGAADAGFDLEAWNETDSASLYEMSNATWQEGTLTPFAPLNSSEYAIGDQVTIRAENNSGGDTYLVGAMTFVVA